MEEQPSDRPQASVTEPQTSSPTHPTRWTAAVKDITLEEAAEVLSHVQPPGHHGSQREKVPQVPLPQPQVIPPHDIFPVQSRGMPTVKPALAASSSIPDAPQRLPDFPASSRTPEMPQQVPVLSASSQVLEAPLPPFSNEATTATQQPTAPPLPQGIPAIVTVLPSPPEPTLPGPSPLFPSAPESTLPGPSLPEPLPPEPSPPEPSRSPRPRSLGRKVARRITHLVYAMDTGIEEGPPSVRAIFNAAQVTTGIHRVYVAFGLIAYIAVYLVIGARAQLVCNVTGFLIPAYCSIRTIEYGVKEDDCKWIVYWMVFASFSLVDMFSDKILKFLPIYWLLKLIFLVYCFIPIEHNGSKLLYHWIIRRFIFHPPDSAGISLYPLSARADIPIYRPATILD
ncbi:uncharacterized protein LOC135367791 isoform X2 [Ornithodoros turicata]|uniref:uncharacterized protein LOC135367791 isoform X2 n=1 Tax=Ornithodoros turicata TaxID=34597 RepID=UPI0031389B3B